MTGFPSKSTFFSRMSERSIVVGVLNDDTTEFVPVSIPLSEVEEIRGMGEERSAIKTAQGKEFSFNLSAAELKRRMYDPARKIADLCRVTIIDEPIVGARMEDGTIYVGLSPGTKDRMFMATENSPAMTFNEAAKYTKRLDVHGHNDWRIPTKQELEQIFNYTHLGKFRGMFSYHPFDRYWSSTESGSDDRIVMTPYINSSMSMMVNNLAFSSRVVRVEKKEEKKKGPRLW